MIRVTIELISARDGHHEILGQGTIVNTGRMNATHSRADYAYVWNVRGNSKRVWKSGVIYDFPRKSLLAYDLLYRCLKATIGDRND